VDEKRLDKTVWNLLNFNAYVKSHIKVHGQYLLPISMAAISYFGPNEMVVAVHKGIYTKKDEKEVR